jgi:hypothetical protein
MDAVAWLTAIYVAVWVGVYGGDIKKDLTPKPTEQQEKVNGNTTNTQK